MRTLGLIGLLGGLAGTIWGSLVGFGVWRTQRIDKRSQVNDAKEAT